jgi:hypothetical protein
MLPPYLQPDVVAVLAKVLVQHNCAATYNRTTPRDILRRAGVPIIMDRRALPQLRRWSPHLLLLLTVEALEVYKFLVRHTTGRSLLVELSRDASLSYERACRTPPRSHTARYTSVDALPQSDSPRLLGTVLLHTPEHVVQLINVTASALRCRPL